jgi:MFS family permease
MAVVGCTPSAPTVPIGTSFILSMNRNLFLISLSLLTWGIGEGMFLSFEPLYLEQLGADPLRIGAILGALGLCMAAAQAPAGYIADRFGRKPVLVSAWLVGLVSAWLMALARSLPVFVVGLLIYGLTAWVITPLNSYATSARGKLSVGRTITLISAVYYAGAILGPLLGGWIGERWGLRYNFLVAGWIFVISTILIIFILPQPVETPHPGERSRDLLKNTGYWRYLGLILAVMTALYIAQPLAPNFLQNERGISLGTIGQLVSVGSVGVVFLNLTLGLLPARMGFIIGQVAVAGFSLLLWQGNEVPWYAAGFFLLGGFRVARNLGTAQVKDLVSPSNLGLAFGILETSMQFATVIAPPIAGFLYARNPSWMFPVSIVLIALTVLLSLRFSPQSMNQASDLQTSEGLSEVL